YTVAAYVTLFFAVYWNLRSWRQIRRLVDVALLASFPVAVLPILQFYELVPAIWINVIAPIGGHRAAATLGNPIFLGSYLILVIPLTLLRLQEATSRPRESRGMWWLGIGLYAALLLIQEAALLMSQSRGPVGAHVVSLFLLVLVWGAVTGRRRLAVSTMVIAGLAALLILALNLPGIFVGPLERLRGTTRLLEALNLWNRAIIWESVAGLLGSNARRAAIGYGPETMAVAVLPHLTPEAAAFANAMSQHWDRAHNATWEALVTTGFVGAIAYLGLFGALFYYGLRTLGLIASKTERRAFIILVGSGAVLGVILPRLVTRSWTWTGLGVPAGLLTGLGIHTVRCMLLDQTRRPGLRPRQRLGIALLAAVVAHFVEMQAAFGTTTSELYFWVYAGLIGTLASNSRLDQVPDENVSDEYGDRVSAVTQRRTRLRQLGSSWWAHPGRSGIEIRWLALIVGGLLATLALSFLFVPGLQFSDLHTVLAGTFAGTWLVGGLIAAVRPGNTSTPACRQWLHYASVSLGWFSLFVLVRFLATRIVGPQVDIVVYLLALVMSTAVLAVTLRRGAERDLPFWQGRIRWTYLPMLILAAGLVWATSVRPVLADVYFNSGQALADQGNLEAGILLYHDALALQPNEDIYYLRLSEAYAKLAQAATDPVQQDNWFEEARKSAQQAWQLNPGQTYHALNLAHVYLLWAQAVTDSGLRTAALDQAASLYAQASHILPYDPKLFREWGLVMQLQGDPDAALDRYQTSLNLDGKQADTYRMLGYLYQDLGKVDAAEEALKRAAALDPNQVDVHVALGEIYDAQGRLQDALAEAQLVVQLAPQDYRGYLNLGLIYRQMGRVNEAAEAVRNAQTYAPDDQQPRLEALLDQLTSQN
ncbi:MAG: tetratricopeptide repeat protein, partial [Anaerolineae bacterium]